MNRNLELIKPVQLEASAQAHNMKNRFRGYLPIVIDVETAGLDSQRNSLLQIAAALIGVNHKGYLFIDKLISWDIEPHPSTTIDRKSLSITGINPFDPNRTAFKENYVVKTLFDQIKSHINRYECHKSILVGHNAAFDLSFLMSASKRSNFKITPIHSFSAIDTASLSMLACGHNVLATACKRMSIPFSSSRAHNASYDTYKTGMLFCKIMNSYSRLA